MLLVMHRGRDLHFADLAPDLYGINNRNLGSFVTDVENSFHMASRLPKKDARSAKVDSPIPKRSIAFDLPAIADF